MKRKNNLFFFCLISILSLIVGFRGNTPDTSVYHAQYRNIDKFSFSDSLKLSGQASDAGFVLLQKVFHKLKFSAEAFLVFISASTFLFYLIACDNFKVNRIYFFIFYLSSIFFIGQFTTIRHELATSALFAGISMQNNKKYYLKIIFFVISILIHYSIAIVLPLVFLVLKNTSLAFKIFNSSLYFIFLKYILNEKLSYFERLSSVFEPTSNNNFFFSFLNLSTLKNVILIVFFTMLFMKMKKSKISIIFFHLCIYGLLFRIIFRKYINGKIS